MQSVAAPDGTLGLGFFYSKQDRWLSRVVLKVMPLRLLICHLDLIRIRYRPTSSEHGAALADMPVLRAAGADLQLRRGQRMRVCRFVPSDAVKTGNQCLDKSETDIPGEPVTRFQGQIALQRVAVL